ncbi:MAG TPA: hypothetical protein VK926_08395 [Gaiellaceae bacterium]|nr:hypothetical protein [Gaiellaceae bacterium]
MSATAGTLTAAVGSAYAPEVVVEREEAAMKDACFTTLRLDADLI